MKPDTPADLPFAGRKVLFLAHRIPYPPDKGDKIRSWNELQALTAENEVTVACFVDDPADIAHVPHLRESCHELIWRRLRRIPARVRSLLALAGSTPLSLAHYRSSAMHRRLQALSETRSFDVVFVFSSTMVPYARHFSGARAILDLCDLDSEKWAQYALASRPPLSLIYRTEAGRLGRFEAQSAREFDVTLLVSETEAETLRERAPDADIRVVPNGVDFDYFDPDAFDVEGDGRTVVFCGAMDYRSNIDAVRHFHDDILPLIRAELPDTVFKIVGSNPASEVLQLGRSEGVEVTGRVADVRPELLGASVSVAPLRLGRGVPNKVLEALALALPVVVTSQGASGLVLDDYEGAVIADGADAFARAVIEQLRAARAGRARYPERRRALAQRHSWSHHLDELRSLVFSAPR